MVEHKTTIKKMPRARHAINAAANCTCGWGISFVAGFGGIVSQHDARRAAEGAIRDHKHNADVWDRIKGFVS
jgi:hypothetical protein